MTAQTDKYFILIDDDPVTNHICSKYIEIVFPGAEIRDFTSPQKGLDTIYAEYSAGNRKNAILFLDINMPVLSGWDVLDRFALFPAEIQNQFTIYILSSSLSSEDKNKANGNRFVAGFVEKPLSVERLQELASELS